MKTATKTTTGRDSYGDPIRVGDWVKVETDGGKPGQVTEFSHDGMVGVALVNEMGRVDLWNPIQVMLIDPKVAALLARKFLN